MPSLGTNKQTSVSILAATEYVLKTAISNASDKLRANLTILARCIEPDLRSSAKGKRQHKRVKRASSNLIQQRNRFSHRLMLFAISTKQRYGAVTSQSLVQFNRQTSSMHTQSEPRRNGSVQLSAIISKLSQAHQAVLPVHFQSRASMPLVQRLQSMGYANEAVEVLTLMTEKDPENHDAWMQLALAANRKGNRQKAADYLTRYYNAKMRLSGLDPQDHPDILQYHLSTEGLAERPSQAPHHYVESLFDEFADSFDDQLVSRLAYKTPQRLFDAFLKSVGADTLPEHHRTLIDLGCGTGLCGECFQQVAQNLIGVDISSQMIAKAESKGIYQELIVSEILAYLQSSREPVDIFIAADVLVYFGELEEFFSACNQRQAAGKLLLFSTEAPNGALLHEDTDSGFIITGSGRFQHSKQYVLDSASQAGYRSLSMTDSILRREQGNDVNGHIYVLEAK